jgi:ATP-dependent DNA helicase RecQ
LYNFQIKHEHFRPLISVILRNFTSSFDEHVPLKLNRLLEQLTLSKKEIESQLKTLEKFGIADIIWHSDLPKVTFLHERLPDDYLQLYPDAYQNKKKYAEQKLSAAISYLKTNSCRAQQLIAYFGQETIVCEICDVCQANKRKDIDTAKLIEEIIEFLKERKTIEEIEFTFGINDEKIKNILRLLIHENKIQFKQGYYLV